MVFRHYLVSRLITAEAPVVLVTEPNPYSLMVKHQDCRPCDGGSIPPRGVKGR